MIARAEADNAVMKFKLVAVVGVIAALMMNVAMVNATRARAADAITYTLEPWDMDGVFGIVRTLTQLQLGGSLCPCVKVPYPADGLHNGVAVDALTKIPVKASDTVLGFSLGAR